MSIENPNLVERIKKVEKRLDDIEKRISNIENRLQRSPLRPPIYPHPIPPPERPERPKPPRPPPEPFKFKEFSKNKGV